MKKRRKAYSVDTMMRFFLQYYNIPTKKDVEKILKRLDRLEAAIKATKRSNVKGKSAKAMTRRLPGTGRTKSTAAQKVVNIIKRYPKGIDIAQLKEKSGFEDKKPASQVTRQREKRFPLPKSPHTSAYDSP